MATNQKKGWKELPVIARAGIVVGGAYLLYELISGARSDEKCLNNLRVGGINPANFRQPYIDLKYDFATMLYTTMSGANMTDTALGVIDDIGDFFGADIVDDTPRQSMWSVLTLTNRDEARDLHNIWINEIPHECATLYDWINGERPSTNSEAADQRAALAHLASFGLG